MKDVNKLFCSLITSLVIFCAISFSMVSYALNVRFIASELEAKFNEVGKMSDGNAFKFPEDMCYEENGIWYIHSDQVYQYLNDLYFDGLIDDDELNDSLRDIVNTEGTKIEREAMENENGASDSDFNSLNDGISYMIRKLAQFLNNLIQARSKNDRWK